MRRLMEKIEDLRYRVEQFGDLGAERELEGLERELQRLQEHDRDAVRKLLRVA